MRAPRRALRPVGGGEWVCGGRDALASAGDLCGKEVFFFFHVSVQFLARVGKAVVGVLLHAGVRGAVGDVQEQSQEGSGLCGAHERVPPLSGEAEDGLLG